MGRLAIVALLCLGLTSCVVGCLESLRPKVDAFPDDIQGAIKATVEKIVDQGVLDTFTSNIEADVINPGIETYAGVLAVGGVYIRGMDGRVRMLSEGTGTQLPPDARIALLERLQDPNITVEERDKILELLTWNRQLSEHNPVP